MRERPLSELLDESERLAAEARARLRAARLDAGLTQSDVAAALGVTKAYVSQVENVTDATVNHPSTGTLLRFAQTIEEGGSHATSSKEKGRSARDDLKKARGEEA